MKSLAVKVIWLIAKVGICRTTVRSHAKRTCKSAHNCQWPRKPRANLYASIRINAQRLSFRSLACYRERREAEVREMEKAKLERERLEKQRAEQAVHKHFEESLRLAQQKVSHALLLVSAWRVLFDLAMRFMLYLSVFIELFVFPILFFRLGLILKEFKVYEPFEP